ncbi:MAG: MOSC domain-containing protein [Acidobacteria bacterium]|nr:MAG: MOSC domain-containing protein [Acidobacteriota bacterium]
MKLLSVNVGMPREVDWQGKIVRTSIFKSPVLSPVRVATLNLEGDQQSDLRVHGGVHKAVYVYPSEHYRFWREEIPDLDLPWGIFGENFTTEGVFEEAVRIGDRFRVGSAEFVVTQPRMPCFKLGIRFGRPEIIKRFLQSGRSGFYFSVAKEGRVTAGDLMEPITRDEHGVTVTDIVNLYKADETSRDLLRRASELPALPPFWRDYFSGRLRDPDS